MLDRTESDEPMTEKGTRIHIVLSPFDLIALDEMCAKYGGATRSQALRACIRHTYAGALDKKYPGDPKVG